MKFEAVLITALACGGCSSPSAPAPRTSATVASASPPNESTSALPSSTVAIAPTPATPRASGSASPFTTTPDAGVTATTEQRVRGLGTWSTVIRDDTTKRSYVLVYRLCMTDFCRPTSSLDTRGLRVEVVPNDGPEEILETTLDGHPVRPAKGKQSVALAIRGTIGSTDLTDLEAGDQPFDLEIDFDRGDHVETRRLQGVIHRPDLATNQ